MESLSSDNLSTPLSLGEGQGVRLIKSELRAMMNGVASATMRNSGMTADYRVNFGVELPRPQTPLKQPLWHRLYGRNPFVNVVFLPQCSTLPTSSMQNSQTSGLATFIRLNYHRLPPSTFSPASMEPAQWHSNGLPATMSSYR